MVLHPNLNKSQWTSVEEEKLQELAKKYNFQDWDAVISELGTNRSPFAAAKHYLTNFSTKYNRDRFTPEEDGYLMEVVKSVEIGSYIPWGKVAYYFENRSRYQLYHRYKYYLAYKNTKKGLFTVEEDALLIFLVNKFGKVFNKIAEYFPNRAPIQLRNRYGCYWNSSDLQYGSYSYEDDLTILNYVEEHGEKSWGKLALTLQRTRAHVRQRYTTLRKWLLSNPELHLLDIPKRSRTLIQQNHSFRNKRVAEILADINDSDDIPKLEDLEQLTHLKMRKDNASKKFHNDLDFDSVDMELRDAVVWPYASKRYMDREKRIKSTERITKLLKMFNQDIDGLIHPDEDYKVFNVRIELFMSYLKNTLEPEAAISIKKEEADKLIIAPNLATIISFSYIRAHLGVVGNENRVSEDLKINIRLKLEHSVLNYNDVVPLEYDKEQLFMQRAYYTFKWSNILSEMYTCLNLKACETTNSTPSANPVIKEEENEESSLYHLTDKNMPPVKKSQTSQLTLKINIADVKKPANKRTHGQTKMFHAKVIRMSKPSLTKEVVNNTLSPTKVIKTDDCFSAHTDIKKISDSKVINVFDPNYRIWTFPKTDPKNFDTIFAKNKDFDMIVFRSCMQPSTSGSTFENFNAVTNVIADNVNVNSELVKSSNEFQIHVVPTFSPNIKEEKDDSSSFYDDNGNLNF